MSGGGVSLEEQRGQIAEAFGGPLDLRQVDPKVLKDSPTNARQTDPKTWDLADITSTAGDLGILENLLARPANGGLELVFGHRRKRAAIALGMERVPVVVRDMSDQEVLRAQWAENGAREDVHPLWEAEHLELMVKGGAEVKDLADEIGQTEGYVRKRLQLCELDTKLRAPYLEGKISDGVALVLARVPRKGGLQAKAYKAIRQRYDSGDDPPTVSEARGLVQREYMRRLPDAPFDTIDVELTKAGACTGCPRRTKNQAVLFDDFSGEDLCTDPKCWKEKCDANWKQRQKKAKAAKVPVLSKKAQGKDFWNWGGDEIGYKGSREWSDLDGEIGWPKKKVRSLFKGRELPPITLAYAPSGRVVELVKRANVDKAQRSQKSSSSASSGSSASAKDRERRKKELHKAKIDRETDARVMARVLERIEKNGGCLQGADWRLLVDLLVEVVWHESAKRVLNRRGVELKKARTVVIELKAHAKTLDDNDLPGLAFELAIAGRMGDPGRLDKVAKQYRIDRASIRKVVAAELKPKPKKKAAKKGRRKKVTKKKAAKKTKGRRPKKKVVK